jgi:hypothetical protein
MKPRYILQFLYLPDPELFRDAIAAIPPNQRLVSFAPALGYGGHYYFVLKNLEKLA